MTKSTLYRYPLRLDRQDKKRVDAVVSATGRTINQVLVLSVRKGLPLAEAALTPPPSRVTNVEPIPESVWNRVYSRKDEMDDYSSEDFSALQSQSEPE